MKQLGQKVNICELCLAFTDILRKTNKEKSATLVTLKGLQRDTDTIMEISQFEEVLLPGAIAPNAEQNVKNVRDLAYREGDIIICTYPKCGSHWVESLIRCLLRKHEEDASISQSSLIDLLPPNIPASMPSPRILFTHMWPKRLPMEHVKNRGKLLLILRNPKDIVVSSFYHYKRSVTLRNTNTWDEHFQAYINGKVVYGDVFKYLEKWQEAMKDEKFDLECFYYEDLKKAPLETLKGIAKHIGVTKTNEEFISIIDECSIDSLKSKVDIDKVPIGLRDDKNQMIIYRKGEIGDWKNHFTVAQNELFDKLLEQNMKGIAFNFKYE